MGARLVLKLPCEEYYLYYDPVCDGKSAGGRWVLDSEQPSSTAATDLDADNACFYHARILVDDQEAPSGTWRSFCADVGEYGAWMDVEIKITKVELETTTPST